MASVDITLALTPGDIHAARSLFLEYADSLNFNLCFQGFQEELASLPGRYAPDAGRLLLAKIDSWPVGCVAMRPLDVTGPGAGAGEPGVCEMKRLYVQPLYRGLGIGRVLAEQVIKAARAQGYRTMRLDTMMTMVEARGLYTALGFVTTAPYNDTPLTNTVYMQLSLT